MRRETNKLAASPFHSLLLDGWCVDMVGDELDGVLRIGGDYQELAVSHFRCRGVGRTPKPIAFLGQTQSGRVEILGVSDCTVEGFAQFLYQGTKGRPAVGRMLVRDCLFAGGAAGCPAIEAQTIDVLTGRGNTGLTRDGNVRSTETFETT